MDTQALEFNTIKTVGTINKDSMLKRVFEKKFGKNYTKIKEQASANKLADETIEFLKSVYEDVILQREDLCEFYNKVDLNTKTPRRYGKTQINADILAQGGKATPLQNTMLNLGKLKSMNSNLLDKGVSDRYKGTEKLSISDLRTINAAIRDFEKKMVSILKK